MAKRLLIGGVVWAVVTALAFLLINWILALFITIVAATMVVVVAMAANWDEHSTFEERENARARRRAVKWEQNKDARERDRARWEAHQARKAEQ